MQKTESTGKPVIQVIIFFVIISMSAFAVAAPKGFQEVPKAEIILQGGKKIQMQTPALQLQPQSQQMIQTKPDVTCSITASYDQGNAQAIQSMGPSSGVYEATQANPPYVVWTHVKIDYWGIKTDQTKDQSFNIAIRFDYKALGALGMYDQQHKDFNYVVVLSPGESYVYDFYSKPLTPGNPLKVTAKVVPYRGAIDSDPGNNGCHYTINFAL
ncbi:MAG: hypothetical protein FJ240_11020 [Nitrospira sp.]|nr:hypothetical protein [Nitrospira sp.]